MIAKILPFGNLISAKLTVVSVELMDYVKRVLKGSIWFNPNAKKINHSFITILILQQLKLTHQQLIKSFSKYQTSTLQ